MNYIYDIILNFKDSLYDFFDWNLNDNVLNIRKMPLFKVDRETLNNIKNYEVAFDKEFLKLIYTKTEVINKSNIKYLDYAFIICDEEEAIGINYKNENIKISKLLVEDELEILDTVDKLELYQIHYKKIRKRVIEKFKTRKEIEISNYLKKELKKLQNENIDKLKYIYFDCFSEIEENRDKIINRLNKELNNNFNNLFEKLYTFFKLVHK